MTTSVSVVVAHPVELMREILGHALEVPLLDIVGYSSSLAELAATVKVQRPAVAVTAPVFDDGNLLDVIAPLISEGTRMLVVSGRTSDDLAPKLLLAGASGLLFVEDASISEIAESVVAVSAGRTALHPDVALAVFQQWREMRAKESADSSGTRISVREADVLAAVARGLTTREISRSLGIAEKTVEAHKSKLYAKLGAKNQAHALALASDLGLISL